MQASLQAPSTSTAQLHIWRTEEALSPDCMMMFTHSLLSSHHRLLALGHAGVKLTPHAGCMLQGVHMLRKYAKGWQATSAGPLITCMREFAALHKVPQMPVCPVVSLAAALWLQQGDLCHKALASSLGTGDAMHACMHAVCYMPLAMTTICLYHICAVRMIHCLLAAWNASSLEHAWHARLMDSTSPLGYSYGTLYCWPGDGRSYDSREGASGCPEHGRPRRGAEAVASRGATAALHPVPAGPL